MKASEVIRQMQSDVASVKAHGDHHVAIACAGFACGVRYLAQLAYSGCPPEQPRRGLKAFAHGLNCITIALGAASFAVFCVGGYSTCAAIAKPSPTFMPSNQAQTGAAVTPLTPPAALWR